MLLFIREMNERVMVIQLALFTRDYNYRVVYVLCSYQWKSPPPPHPGPRWGNVGDFYGILRHGLPVGWEISQDLLYTFIELGRGAR